MKRARAALRLGVGALRGAAAGLGVFALGAFVLPLLQGTGVGDAAAAVPEAVGSFSVSELAALVVGAVAGALGAGGAWRFWGVVSLTGLACVVVGFFAYALGVTLPQVPGDVMPASLALLLVEGVSLTMVVVYAFYGLDVYVRRRWRRSPERVAFSRYHLPKVAFHVACFNEPPALVEESLRALSRLDYPADRYVVMVLDDSTKEECRAPLAAFCREHGFVYVHRADRRGFKAGALNHALTLTPPDVELVSVLDADYQLEPAFLKENVGHFVDPNLAFLQTPQDYRNPQQSFLTRGYYYADAYFYRAILPSRNEQNAIIFCGTMGLIRKSALESVGGWGEEFITEDSELSVRVLEHGYASLYVNRTYGRGLIPPTFDAYKKQLHRWSFGSVKVIKAHFKDFLFSHLTVRQKFDFFVGNLHWFDGLWICTIAGTVATLAVADVAGADVLTHHSAEVWLLGLVPVFLLLDGVVRLHMSLGRNVRVGLGTSLRVMGMWYAIKFNNMFAALKGLFGFRMPFVRTPKAPERRPTRLQSLSLAVRLCRFELCAGLALVGVGLANAADALGDEGAPGSKWALTAWALHYGALFLVAPAYAYKSFSTYDPAGQGGGRPTARPRPAAG